MQKNIILILSICFFLASCTHFLKPYQPPVQQGNIITQDAMKNIKVGMSKQQVVDILGYPVLIDPFDNNTWNYVYYLKPSKGPVQQKRLIIYLQNDRVARFTTN